MASLLILAGTFWSVFNYPIGALILLIAVLVYGAVVFFYPVAWLVVLPLMLPLIDLAPWTGRFFLDEFDIFVAMTLAVSWWKDRHLPYAAGFTLTGKWLLGLFAASTVISVCLGAAPLPAIDANAFSSYLSHYNALRVAKGFFWALLLVFPLNRRIEENPSLAWFLLATGILVGLAGVGVVALWERQIFGELFNGASLYSIAGRMMEFGTSYRITGMFSGMHTGGEAIDGYLVLALPVACFVAVFAHRFSTRIVASISLALGTYALVSTFTRATYGAFAGSVLIFSVLAAVRYRELLISNWRPWALGLTSLLLITISLALVRIFGGYQGLAASVFSLWIAAVCGLLWARRLKALLVPMIIGVTILCGYSIFDDVLENERGVVHQTSLSFAFSAGLSLFFVSAMTATSYMAGRHFRLSSITVMAVLITLVWLIALPALGGFTFSKRISSTTSDLTTRRHHWANSWNVVDDHQDELFGIGLGGFPRRYFDNHVGTVKLASYQVSAEGLTSFLKLGSAEFVLSQRVDGTGGRQYLFRAKLRMKEKRQSIMVRLCRKHILYFDSLNCKGVRLKSRRTGSFEPYEVAINAGNLGPKAFVRWPMTLTIGAHGETVDITEVELLNS